MSNGAPLLLEGVAAALATCHEIGPGAVYFVCKDAQRRFFIPPAGRETSGANSGKYGRP
jgi:hypothetical protein